MKTFRNGIGMALKIEFVPKEEAEQGSWLPPYSPVSCEQAKEHMISNTTPLLHHFYTICIDTYGDLRILKINSDIFQIRDITGFGDFIRR